MKDRNLFVARLACGFPQFSQVIHTSASLTFQELEVNQLATVCQTFCLFYLRPQQTSARHTLLSLSNHRNRRYLASINLQKIQQPYLKNSTFGPGMRKRRKSTPTICAQFLGWESTIICNQNIPCRQKNQPSRITSDSRQGIRRFAIGCAFFEFRCFVPSSHALSRIRNCFQKTHFPHWPPTHCFQRFLFSRQLQGGTSRNSKMEFARFLGFPCFTRSSNSRRHQL